MSEDVKKAESPAEQPEAEEKVKEASVEKTPFRDQIPYQALLLGGFALIASSLLAAGNVLTKDEIKLRKKEDMLSSLAQVVPPEVYDNNIIENKIYVRAKSGREVEVYQGTKNGDVSSLAYSMAKPGYSGDITVLMGVDNTGELMGVRVLSHTETPGLGDKIEIEKDDWITAFAGQSFANLDFDKWKVKKDGGVFDQFSGATITPRTVVNAVKEGLIFFRDNKDTLLTVKTEEISQ